MKIRGEYRRLLATREEVLSSFGRSWWARFNAASPSCPRHHETRTGAVAVAGTRTRIDCHRPLPPVSSEQSCAGWISA